LAAGAGLLQSSRASSTYKGMRKPEFQKIGRIKAALFIRSHETRRLFRRMLLCPPHLWTWQRSIAHDRYNACSTSVRKWRCRYENRAGSGRFPFQGSDRSRFATRHPGFGRLRRSVRAGCGQRPPRPSPWFGNNRHRGPSVRSVNPTAHRSGITAPHLLSRASPPGGTSWERCCRPAWTLRWLRSVLGREGASYAELVQLAAEVQPGSEGLFFLPYLVGERSPLMDPEAKAGYRISSASRSWALHTGASGGVAFALGQIVDTMVGCGADLIRLVASGNGLANPIWRQIVADILNRPHCQGTGEQASERAGVGAAMIAGIGSGVFDGYQDAQKLAPIFNVVTEPNRETVALYEPHYRSFLEIYPRMKSWRAI
jgi:hypothetical protein